MRTRSALGLATALTLAACAHEAPQGAQPMSWSLNHTESEGAKLAYGVPQTDQVLVMMTCQMNSGRVEVSMTAPQERARGRIGLASRGERLELAAEVAPSPMGDLAVVMAQTDAAQAALDRFAHSGDLTVSGQGRAVKAVARGEDRAKVADFFGACRRSA